jgi:carboxyl-terminal processing protease
MPFPSRRPLLGLLLALTLPLPALAAQWEPALQAIEALLARHSHDPQALQGERFERLRAELRQLGRSTPEPAAFIEGFNRLWSELGPFSHVRLLPRQGSAEQFAQHLDQMRVGPRAVRLSWNADIAVLKVSTLMGQDTLEALGAAYREIAARPTRALVIDLRDNPGGAFAVRPLVGHLIAEPVDAGVFLPRRSSQAPSRSELQVSPAWQGWSLQSFWADVQEKPFTRIRFEPVAPHYAGPVAVLTSARTASAAEMAVDALLGAGRVRVLGERTAGQMLTQKPFEVPGTPFMLMLPVADYHGWHSGRIEGRGIAPTQSMPAAAALDAALSSF